MDSNLAYLCHATKGKRRPRHQGSRRQHLRFDACGRERWAPFVLGGPPGTWPVDFGNLDPVPAPRLRNVKRLVGACEQAVDVGFRSGQEPNPRRNGRRNAMAIAYAGGGREGDWDL